MTATIAISIIITLAMGAMLWMAIKELAENSKEMKEAKRELMRRLPTVNNEGTVKNEPTVKDELTAEGIAQAIRTEGYVPEVDKDCVRFKVQGEVYTVGTDRLPLIFILKAYEMDPKEYDTDLLKEAGRRMSERIIMAKFGVDDDSITCFVAALDRNYDSFRANLSRYITIIDDGHRETANEYNKLQEEMREKAELSRLALPTPKPETKIVS